MSFLGLVGIPANAVTYPVYQGLKALSPALGAAFAGAESAAALALLGNAAAVVGAGALGWMIGSAIRQQLGLDDPPFVLSDFANIGETGTSYRIFFDFTNPPNEPQSGAITVPGPVRGVLRRERSDGAGIFYFRGGEPASSYDAATFGVQSPDQAKLEITSVTKIGTGEPVAFRKVPVVPGRPPYVPVRTPITIPATPKNPSFPITPYVVPLPDLEPDEDNKLEEPGITVKIPELGLQIQYTPTGVRIGQYSDKDTQPFTPPKVALPPGTIPPATDPCPCPEKEEPKELLCRVKKLQDELLNDGFERDIHSFGDSQAHYVDTGNEKEFEVTIVITQQPVNGRRIPYAAPVEDVLFAGWFAFAYGQSIGERFPLDYIRKTFRTDQKADGFYVACNKGYKATGTYTKYIKKPYIDEC